MTTFQAILDRHDIAVPEHLEADAAVPVLTRPQRQGDVFIAPRELMGDAERARAVLVPRDGIAVVRGEATGNTHMLDADGECWWLPGDGQLLGTLHVAAGATAWLIHTDEHGANGIGPGTYRLHGKREQADEIRRVAD